MAAILIVYSSTDGHTLTICSYLQTLLERRQHQVSLCSIQCPPSVAEMALFDQIVIGASIRYGHHGRRVRQFVQQHRSLLECRPSAFFSVNLVARKANRNMPETNPYLKKFLRHTHWQPTLSAVFAGKIDYQKYGRLDRAMIRLIMWMTNGPTDPKTVAAFTDWQQVAAFAEHIAGAHQSRNKDLISTLD